MAIGIDRRGVPITIAANVGADVEFTVGLLDMQTGAVSGVGATIVATVGGQNLTVDSSTAGLFACSLSDSQTTALGAGSHALVFTLTPAAGLTQPYVRGAVVLSDSADAGGAYQAIYGYVNGVLVGVE